MFGVGRSSFSFVAVALALLACVTGGCDASSAASAFADTQAAGPDNNAPTLGGDGAFSAADDAATKAPEAFRGSSLCKVKSGSCVPDDDGYHNATGATSCAVVTSSSDGAPAVTEACRLTKEDGGAYAPVCDGAGSGGDGAACSAGVDCAAGFDCVAGDSGGVCRRYCCLGSCGSQGSTSGGSTFCDVQKLVAGNKAPVCMPLKHCTLLGTGECDATETCGVVNENGESGCVANGDAQVNQDCDQSHCASGLSCLGQAGNRKCYQLCAVGSATCGAGQTCKTSALFKDQSVGVCQPQ